MAPNNDQLSRSIVAAQSSITSLSIFIALSVAIIGLLISQPSIEFGYNTTIVSSFSLMLAIIFFLLSLEFFILCIYHCEHIEIFGLVASCAYAAGVFLMLIGFTIGIMVFEITILPYLFLSISFLVYFSYYIFRMAKLGSGETNFKVRIAARVVYLLLFLTGYALIATLGG